MGHNIPFRILLFCFKFSAKRSSYPVLGEKRVQISMNVEFGIRKRNGLNVCFSYFPHSTFQLPHSKVPDTLTEENPRNIIIKNQYHQQYKKKQAYLLGDFSDLNADRTTFDGFDRKEEQVPAVQDRDGQQVDNG